MHQEEVSTSTGKESSAKAESERIDSVRRYLHSDDFVCGPGKGAIIRGTIPIIACDLSEHPNSSSYGIQFQNVNALRKAIREQLHLIRSNKHDGMVIVSSDDEPLTHGDALLRSYEFYIQMYYEAHKIQNPSQFVPNLEQQIRNQVMMGLFNDRKPPKFIELDKDKNCKLFLTAMSPLFEDFDGKKHPRYAPHFCIAVIDYRAFKELDKTGVHDSSFRKILSEVALRSKTPYDTAAIYPVPDDPRFAQHDLVNLEQLYYQLSTVSGVLVPKDVFLREALSASTAAGIALYNMREQPVPNSATLALYRQLTERGVLSPTLFTMLREYLV